MGVRPDESILETILKEMLITYKANSIYYLHFGSISDLHCSSDRVSVALDPYWLPSASGRHRKSILFFYLPLKPFELFLWLLNSSNKKSTKARVFADRLFRVGKTA